MNAADEFLALKEKFQLGDLPTESPHPKTAQLSDWAKRDVARSRQCLCSHPAGPVLRGVPHGTRRAAEQSGLPPVLESGRAGRGPRVHDVRR